MPKKSIRKSRLNVRSTIRGGRRSEAEKATAKCFGEQDPVYGDILPEYAVRLKEGDHFFCFDIRTLFEWFKTGKRTNPFTNVNFSQANITKIQKKFFKVGLSVAHMTLRDRLLAEMASEIEDVDEREFLVDYVITSYFWSDVVAQYGSRPDLDTLIVNRLAQQVYNDYMVQNYGPEED